jgi:hypothetical protein
MGVVVAEAAITRHVQNFDAETRRRGDGGAARASGKLRA